MTTPEAQSAQSEQLKAYLVSVVNKNQFNAFCIDCQKQKSTYANISFGTYICEHCARSHISCYPQFAHYIKPLFTEVWDTF
mmetsp:Transcript_53677/g.73596  ORF Transcript_53677/g.73596 Transcript_53677/m.73596 type:complete len:81 (-) Transcript_53677:443-685(-)